MKRQIKVKLEIQTSKSGVYCDTACQCFRMEMPEVPFCFVFGLLKKERKKIIRSRTCIRKENS